MTINPTICHISGAGAKRTVPKDKCQHSPCYNTPVSYDNRRADEGREVFTAPAICYLFLGGAGAGVCLVLAVLGLAVPRSELAAASLSALYTPLRYDERLRVRTRAAIPDSLRKLISPGYALSEVLLILGVMCLLADLGRPDRVERLLFTPRLAYLTVGAYALVACMMLVAVLGLVFARVVHRCPLGLLRGMQIASIPVALAVMLYTGLLLSTMPSVPLWNTWCVPILFVCSGVSCGVAFLVALSRLTTVATHFPRAMRLLLVWGAVLMAVELAVLAGYLALVPKVWPPDTATGVAAAQSLEALLTGEAGLLFQVGYVICGLVIPFVMACVLAYALPRVDVSLTPFMLLTAAFVVVGGFIMRWCVVMAGMQPTALLL